MLGLSILHLLDNKEETIAKVQRMLKPGGVFVTSTSCIGDTMKLFKIIAPIGRFLGLMPLVKVFTTDELVTSLTDAGFEIDHQWQPGRGKAVFIVAQKATADRYRHSRFPALTPFVSSYVLPTARFGPSGGSSTEPPTPTAP